MALIFTPVAKTPVQEAAENIKKIVAMAFAQMKAAHESGAYMFWQRADPQAVSDELGTDAGELFRLAGILMTAINTAAPGTVASPVPANATVTVNPNGTVTIGQNA